jgi:hypothetical protein
LALRGWSWDAGWGPAAVGDRSLREALELALPDAVVEAAIEATGAREQRRSPMHLVVTLVVAIELWASGSMWGALAEVVAGLAGGNCRARRPLSGHGQRAGARLFRVLFQAVTGHMATAAGLECRRGLARLAPGGAGPSG